MPDDVGHNGLLQSGDHHDNYAYQTVNGITFGYLSYTEHTNGLPTPSGTDYGVVYLDDHETIAKTDRRYAPELRCSYRQRPHGHRGHA